MPPKAQGFRPAILWLIVLVSSLSALAFIVFFIVPNCAALPVWGRNTGTCGEKMWVVYVCSAMFLAGTFYSGYRLAREEKGRY